MEKFAELLRPGFIHDHWVKNVRPPTACCGTSHNPVIKPVIIQL
jgi:hypothetical protein